MNLLTFYNIELINILNRYIKENLNDIQRLDVIRIFCSPSQETYDVTYKNVIKRINECIEGLNEIAILTITELFNISEDLVFANVKHLLNSLSSEEKKEVLLTIDTNATLSSKELEGYRKEIVYLSFFTKGLFSYIEDEIALL